VVARGAVVRLLQRTVEPAQGNCYFSFRHGPIAVLALDTYEDKADSHPECGGLDNFASYR